jgi:hypothetical protein
MSLTTRKQEIFKRLIITPIEILSQTEVCIKIKIILRTLYSASEKSL